MTPDFFEQLLREEESNTLDFKEEQYPFVAADDNAKSELLKDILGFANAFKRSDGYILIGVRDIRGDRSEVVGIADQLDDHSLQQFVNSKTNLPILFHYEAFGIENKQVGIIRIDKEQHRPIFLKKSYGKLEKEKVYVRKGSSTDPTKPANPSEIALMVQNAVPDVVSIEVLFARLDVEEPLGDTISLETECLKQIPTEQIPDFEFQLPRPLPGLSVPHLARLDVEQMGKISQTRNPDYYRELFNYLWHKNLFRQVRLMVRNKGQVVARKVRCEFSLLRSSGIAADSRVPDVPKAWVHNFIPKQIRYSDDFLPVKQTSNSSEIRFDCGDLQPGRKFFTKPFVLAPFRTGRYEVTGEILAENLPRPEKIKLTVQADVVPKIITIDELTEIDLPQENNDNEDDE